MPALDTPRAKNRALILLATAQFMLIIDSSITNVALPTIGRDLRIDQTNLTWIINAYTLAFGGFLLLGGRLADLLGRRRMFILGLAVFGAGSSLGGVSGSSGFLDGARALQGLGAAMVAPAALSLVTTIFAEGSERNRALGVWGGVSGAGGAVGVLLGGILTQIDWRLVLFINVPVAIGAIILAPRLLNESTADTDATGFDIPGAVTVTAGLALLVYAFIKASSSGWGSSTTLLRIAGAVVLLGAFVVIELRSRYPLMPFRIFRLRTLRGANLTGLLFGMALFAMFLFISYYLQYVLDYSPVKTGLAYLPVTVAVIVFAGVGSQLVTRGGFKLALISGLVILAAGLWWFSQIPAHGAFLANVLGPSIVSGAGLGLAIVSVTIAAVAGIDPHEAGLASGLINTTEQIGGALGVAILVSISTARTADFGAAAHTHAALTAGYSRAFLIAAGFSLLSAVVAALLISSTDAREHATAAQHEEPQAVHA